MSGILLAILLLQAVPQNVGAVTGVVRGANGMPAAGVRVYAIAVRDTAEAASSAAPLESQVQTDSTGRYRLEMSPGRYYIASGSVNAPTYYPGTTDLAGARAVAVVSGGLVDTIDFSSFIPATRALSDPVIQGTGFISGVIRFPDGAPAAGIAVSAAPVFVVGGSSAIPASSRPIVVSSSPFLVAPGPVSLPPVPAAPQSTIRLLSGVPRRTVSDATGAYVLQNLAPDTYYIAAGFAEAPTLYPGVTDILAARPIVTTPTTNLMAIDFTVPRPPPALVLSGRVFGIADGNTDVPAAGAMLEIKSASPVVSFAYGLPANSAANIAFAGPDGKFQFSGVRSGTYTLSASFSGVRTEARNVVVADQPLSNLDFLIPLAAFSGRIVAEDGTAFPNSRLFDDVIVTTADNPYVLASTTLPIEDDGTFSRLLEGGTYRFRLRTLPEEYSIKSVVAGGVDLLKETLKLSGKEPVSVEVRVAKRTPSPEPGGTSVRGRVVDAVTGSPSAAARITLCCRDSGPVERFSAPMNPDGSFEFAAVTAGRYSIGLLPNGTGQNLFLVNGSIDIGSEGARSLEWVSTAQFGPLAATILFEAGNSLPLDSRAQVVFTGANERVRVVAQRGADGTYLASVPIGGRYNISVTDLPEGYVVKSITGSTEARPANYPPVGVPPPITPIVITLAPVR